MPNQDSVVIILFVVVYVCVLLTLLFCEANPQLYETFCVLVFLPMYNSVCVNVYACVHAHTHMHAYTHAHTVALSHCVLCPVLVRHLHSGDLLLHYSYAELHKYLFLL